MGTLLRGATNLSLFVRKPMLKVRRLGSTSLAIAMVRRVLISNINSFLLTSALTGIKRNTHNLTPETRKKNRRSRRCECPMHCAANKTTSDLWELTVRNGEHNHGPYEPPPKKKKGTQRQEDYELNAMLIEDVQISFHLHPASL